MTKTFYYIGLGSNLGNRSQNISNAIKLLKQRVGKLSFISKLVETEPWGYNSPNRYVNAAVGLISEMEPHDMLTLTQQLERDMGRTNKTTNGHYEDRIIDIDILVCENHVVYTSDLRLPHPRMWQRPFVQETLTNMFNADTKEPYESDFGDTKPRVATIGFFDGMHRGHQHLLNQLKELNKGRRHRALVLTFDRHPHDILHPDEPPVGQLTTLQSKKQYFSHHKNEAELWLLHFNPEMAALTAREFMEYVLRDQLNVDTLLIGYDHHFGHPLSKSEGFEDYCRIGQELGIRVVQATELPGGQHVSSSAIRRALTNGDFALAEAMLGHGYDWSGIVVHGHEVGRRLGFPTANLKADNPELLLPSHGVYAAWAYMPYYEKRIPAMVNIGTRPTVDDGKLTIEAHLLDFNDDIYGKRLNLTFVSRMRDEQRFDSEAALAEQLRHDREAVRTILTTEKRENQPHPRPILKEVGRTE